MSIDSKLPATPKGNIAGWLAFISAVLVLAFVVDNYWGDGNLFGLAKKKTTPVATPTV